MTSKIDRLPTEHRLRLKDMREKIDLERRIGDVCHCDQPDCSDCRVQFLMDVVNRLDK